MRWFVHIFCHVTTACAIKLNSNQMNVMTIAGKFFSAIWSIATLASTGRSRSVKSWRTLNTRVQINGHLWGPKYARIWRKDVSYSFAGAWGGGARTCSVTGGNFPFSSNEEKKIAQYFRNAFCLRLGVLYVMINIERKNQKN